MAPVELICLAGGKAHRHISPRRNLGAFSAPSFGETMHAVVSAVVAVTAQLLEQALGRAALPPEQALFLLQNLRQNIDPFTELRRRLDAALVLELCLVAAHDLANRRTRHR